MIIYRNDVLDPYFNLASEQYLLDTANDDIFMLWRNSKAVIIGKNQNAYAELNIDFVEKNRIKVVRRLTGGGAVFHDEGNVNFSFIVPGDENAVLNFARFTEPIIEALTSLGVKGACLSGRNDIMIGEQKISGNAQCRYNGKTLHHGTLLFSADLSEMEGALKVDPEKISSKGIKSVRNRVGNIKEHLKTDMDTVSFMDYLLKYMSNASGSKISEFSEKDTEAIRKLSDEKYSTWEWNFGKSKEFSTKKKKRFPFGSVETSFLLNGGIICEAEIRGDFFGTRDVKELEKTLAGKKFERRELENCLTDEMLGGYISGMDAQAFIDLLMS